MKQLVDIHAKHNKESGLLEHEAKILRGALDYANRQVKEVMTAIEKMFMLELNQKLDAETLAQIWETGLSRIPIYKKDRNNIISILFVKDLILINPEDNLSINTVLAFYGREALKVFPDMHLDQLLLELKTGKSHMAIVHEPVEPADGGDPYYQTLGLVTLEDVIEEIIHDEIIDETDVVVQQQGSDEVTVMKQQRVNVSDITRLGKRQRLSPKQVAAVSSYMIRMIPVIQLLPEDYVKSLLSHAPIITISPEDKKDSDILLYNRGKEADFFILVLSGKLEVTTGADNFVSENGSWSWLGLRGITNLEFIPDFDCKVVKQTSFIRITRADFTTTIDMILREQPNWTLPKHLQWMEARKLTGKDHHTGLTPTSPMVLYTSTAPSESSTNSSVSTKKLSVSEEKASLLQSQDVEISIEQV